MKKMKICYFGTYEKDYHRNRAFIDGLKKNNVEVVECHEPAWEKIKHKNIKSFLSYFLKIKIAYIKLFLKALKLRKSKQKFDYIIVGYPPFIDIFIAKLIFGKKILFNPLVSLYDTLVEDRRYVRGIFIKLVELFDRLSYKISDMVFIDTKTHADYLIKKYPISKDKIKVIPVGIDERFFFPKKSRKKQKDFLVYFHGKFIPLHGIEKIISSAKLLGKYKEIRFLIIGTGQLEKEISNLIKRENLKNIERIKWAKYDNLMNYINNADICLGIFGSSEKAKIVIPTKVYEYLACGKAIITMESPAAREIFKNRENAILCQNNPEAIAKSILFLKKNNQLRKKISENAYNLFRENFTTEIIGKRIRYLLSSFD